MKIETVKAILQQVLSDKSKTRFSSQQMRLLIELQVFFLDCTFKNVDCNNAQIFFLLLNVRKLNKLMSHSRLEMLITDLSNELNQNVINEKKLFFKDSIDWRSSIEKSSEDLVKAKKRIDCFIQSRSSLPANTIVLSTETEFASLELLFSILNSAKLLQKNFPLVGRMCLYPEMLFMWTIIILDLHHKNELTQKNLEWLVSEKKRDLVITLKNAMQMDDNSKVNWRSMQIIDVPIVRKSITTLSNKIYDFGFITTCIKLSCESNKTIDSLELVFELLKKDLLTNELLADIIKYPPHDAYEHKVWDYSRTSALKVTPKIRAMLRDPIKNELVIDNTLLAMTLRNLGYIVLSSPSNFQKVLTFIFKYSQEDSFWNLRKFNYVFDRLQFLNLLNEENFNSVFDWINSTSSDKELYWGLKGFGEFVNSYYRTSDAPKAKQSTINLALKKMAFLNVLEDVQGLTYGDENLPYADNVRLLGTAHNIHTLLCHAQEIVSIFEKHQMPKGATPVEYVDLRKKRREELATFLLDKGAQFRNPGNLTVSVPQKSSNASSFTGTANFFESSKLPSQSDTKVISRNRDTPEVVQIAPREILAARQTEIVSEPDSGSFCLLL